ncbi:hypothetical protein Tco_1342710, partial [Tanacetum coccineum]
IFMSDSEDSTITYTVVSSSFGGLSDIESPRVDGPPVMPEDLYAYVFMPPEDEVFLAEEKPLPTVVSPTADSPTADSPGYIVDSDLEEDEEDPDKDPTDYPADGGDDDDDDKSSDDVEEEEEMMMMMMMMSHASDTEYHHHVVSSPIHVSPPPLPASPTYPLGYRAAMIRQRAESPSTYHSLLLPPPIILSHTRAFVAMMKATAPSTYILASRSETPSSGTPPLLSILLPTPLPPLLLPSTDCRAGVSEAALPPRKRLCIALGSRYEVGESSSAPTARPNRGLRVDYGFVGTLDDDMRREPERYVGYGITDTWEDIDTNEIYGRLDDAQDDRLLMSGRLNMLFRDRCAHSHTALLMEREARLSHEAWGRSMDASDTTRSEVRALRTTILAQQTESVALRVADRAGQAQLMETLRLMSTLQTQVTAL